MKKKIKKNYITTFPLKEISKNRVGNKVRKKIVIIMIHSNRWRFLC